MNAALILGFVLALLDKSCPGGEKTVSPIRITFSGPNCTVPLKTYVRWWNKRAKLGETFNVKPDEVNDEKRMGVYEPPVVWLTSEDAAGCVRGGYYVASDTCAGFFTLPCARTRYELTVSEPSLKVNILRSMSRVDDKQRCETPAAFVRDPRDNRYTDGEWLTVALYAGQTFLCQKVIRLDELGGNPFEDTFDTAEGTWSSETAGRHLTGRSLSDIEKRQAADRANSAPVRKITITLTPVAR